MGQGINSADEAKNGKSKTTLLRTVDTRGVSRDVLVTLVWPASDARPARQRVIYGRSEAVFDTDSEDPREAVHRWGNFCIAEIRGHGELTAAEQLAAANARADAAERERDVLRDQLAAVTADAVDAEENVRRERMDRTLAEYDLSGAEAGYERLARKLDAAEGRVAELTAALRFSARECARCSRLGVWISFNGIVWCDEHKGCGAVPHCDPQPIEHADVLRSLGATDGAT